MKICWICLLYKSVWKEDNQCEYLYNRPQPVIAIDTFEIFCLLPNLELKSTTNRDIPYMKYVEMVYMPENQYFAEVKLLQKIYI